MVFGPNEVVFWANTVLVGANTVVFGSNTVVFWVNTMVFGLIWMHLVFVCIYYCFLWILRMNGVGSGKSNRLTDIGFLVCIEILLDLIRPRIYLLDS